MRERKQKWLWLLIFNVQIGVAAELRQLLRETDTDQSCAVLRFHQTYYDFPQRVEEIDALYRDIDQMSEQERLSFYFIASQTLTTEAPQQALEYVNAGFSLAMSLQNEAQQVYFSMLELEIKLDLQPLEKAAGDLKRLTQLRQSLEALPNSHDKGMIYLIYVRISEMLENRYDQLYALYTSVHMLEYMGKDEINACTNQLLGLLYNELGNYYSAMKDGQKSRDYHRMALTAFQQNNDLSRIGVAKFNLGLIALREGKHAEAIEYFEKVIALKQQLQEDFGMALSHMHMGAILNETNQPQEAYQHLQIAIPLLEARQANNRLAFAYAYLGETYSRLGRIQQADVVLMKSLDFAEKYLPPFSRMQVYQQALEHLSSDQHTERKKAIMGQFLEIQSVVLDSIQQDVSARSEAEALLSQQKNQNKMLSYMAGIQKNNLALQQNINAQQKRWIIGLGIVVLGLLWSVWRQVKTAREKTILANTDYLTGLMNRRSFYDELGRVHAAAEEGQVPYFLLIMDIDHFKEVNDTYGHSMGDVVLIELSKLINSVDHNCCDFFRIGGEEFAAICAFKNAREASHFAEKIRRVVEKHDWIFGQVALNITISIGLSGIDKTQTLTDAVKQADRALYQAKNGGRNRVELWQPESAQVEV